MDLDLIVIIVSVIASFLLIIYTTIYYLLYSKYEHFRRFDKIIIPAVILLSLSVVISPFYLTFSRLIKTFSLLLFLAAFYIEFKELAYFHSKTKKTSPRKKRRVKR
jgi:chromate transport protein ChrA